MVKVISWYSSTGCTCYLHRFISYFDSLTRSEVNMQHIIYVFVLTSPTMSRMSGSSTLYGFRDGWQVAVQLLFCGVLPPGLVQYSSKYYCVIVVKLFLHTLSQRPRGASMLQFEIMNKKKPSTNVGFSFTLFISMFVYFVMTCLVFVCLQSLSLWGSCLKICWGHVHKEGFVN